MNLKKYGNPFLINPAKAGIPYSYFKTFWTPASAGVTPKLTFHESIEIDGPEKIGIGVMPRAKAISTVLLPAPCPPALRRYSHSIVLGGFEEMS